MINEMTIKIWTNCQQESIKRMGRWLLIGIALVLLLGMATIVYAEETGTEDPLIGTEEPTIGTEAPPVIFSDVEDPSSWYYRPVHWALENQLTTGIREGAFGPEESCTRAQILTFLWRAAGEPEPVFAENPFSDVPEDAYYRNAVLWAVEKGITQGMTEDLFDPDQTCTRAQCVTFLWRYRGSPDDGIRSNFSDVGSDSYYGAAVFWALKNGVTNGMDLKTFSPGSICSRAQVMTFLYRSIAESVEVEALRKSERPEVEWVAPQINGTNGTMLLSVENRGTIEPQEVRVSVWTEEDQSDLRWFQMEASKDDRYESIMNVGSFGNHFGTYYISLSALTDSGDSVRLVHLEDTSFEVEPEYFMTAEDAGKGMVYVDILGVDEEVPSLTIEARGSQRDPVKSVLATAEKTENGSWRALVDVISFMDQGSCYLDAYLPGMENGEPVNTIRIPVQRYRRVVDVSQHQGNINWRTAKNSGIFEGAILRCGYRGSRGSCGRDPRFQANAEMCQKLGIPMGVYWFTSALTVQEAVQEADYCARLIAPYHLSFPVFLDSEWGGRAGLNDLDPAVRTQCLIAFLKRIEEYGYEAGLYASGDWMSGYLNYEELSSWFLWAPAWKARPSVEDYQAWQYTATAVVPGISGNTVDLSYWFGW